MSTTLVTALKRNSLDDGPGIRTVVFFKGCPLSCVWCQNPETKSREQQLSYEAADCVNCQSCMQACPLGAIDIQPNGSYPVDKSLCTLTQPHGKGASDAGERCPGYCVLACPAKALTFAGTPFTEDELCKKLLKDTVFYRNSGGGVTFSGGEPTLSLYYLASVAARLKAEAIPICLETCGLYHHNEFERLLLPYLDLVYFDIKLIDNALHKKYCGVSNGTILSNFKALLATKSVEVLPRVPLVPGITATTENLLAIRDFFKECGVTTIGLLPYNPLWLSKLTTLGASTEFEHSQWTSRTEKEAVKEIFVDFTFRDF